MNEKEERISEIMNLIGYGLAKFDLPFANEFGCPTKASFCRLVVSWGLAHTEKAVTNRQDSFDPYFANGRKGWHQRNQREHIKLFIDSLFGEEDVQSYSNIVKMYIQDFNSSISLTSSISAPTTKSKFKQLQETGREAEFFFINNYQKIPIFDNGILEDARLWGDGYDFQIQNGNHYFLAEVKGVREKSGTIRMTQNEYNKATEYKNDFILVIISHLSTSPKLNWYVNPLSKLTFFPKLSQTTQSNYYSELLTWQ